MLKVGKENKSPSTKLAKNKDLYFHLFGIGKEKKSFFHLEGGVGGNSKAAIPPFPVFAPKHGDMQVSLDP